MSIVRAGLLSDMVRICARWKLLLRPRARRRDSRRMLPLRRHALKWTILYCEPKFDQKLVFHLLRIGTVHRGKGGELVFASKVFSRA